MNEPSRRSAELPAGESDRDAFGRLLRGDIGALGVLYDNHYLAILRFIRRVTRNSADAEDLAQEVFLVAARSAASFDGRASCRPWLFGIAARLLLHRGRRSARLAQFLDRLACHPRHVPNTSPHDVLVRRELNEQLELALSRLSEEKRIVVLLTEVEGLKSEEVARILDIPVGTVWTRLHHARRALRQRLERRVR